MLRPFFLPTLFAALAVLPAIAVGQSTGVTERPGLEVRATATPPKIDGVLDDDAWREAAHSDAFRQVEPGEDADPTERTEFWVTFDPDHVYVAIRSHDSGGLQGIRAYSMQHDQDNGSDDLVRVVLDTFHRENDGYYFALTAAGGKHDGLIQNKDQGNDDWDGLWFGKVTRDAGGWSAEFAIPAKSLAFDPANGSWGLDIGRAIRRKQEVVRWANHLRNKPTISLPHLGEIRGLTGLRQGRGLEFKPYASITRNSDPAPEDEETEFKPGFDLVWHVTPSLAATLTVNTDFADAEVDERQVNLGRFPLFFPEKRSFFTQDASLFAFGGINRDPLPFFSRRIGLANDGSEVDIIAGAKLTGRAGPWTLGILDVQTAEHQGVESKNLLVGRVARQVFDESSAGIVFTQGDPQSNGDNHLVGVDFNYVNTHLPGDKTITVRTSVQGTDSESTGGTGTATAVIIDYPNDPFGFSGWFSAVDEKYDPALGFVSRTGVGNAHTSYSYNVYSTSPRLRMAQFFIETEHTTDLHLDVLDDLYLGGVYAENPSGDFANFWAGQFSETYDEPFEIQPGIIIPTGVHRWAVFQAQFGTTRSRPFNARVRWRHGGFLTGHADDYYLDLGARPSNKMEFGLSGGLRDIRLPEGSFQVRTATARAVYTFSPDLEVSLLGQYDNLSAELGVNFRIKWIVQPGNEVFFIINQGYDTSLDSLRPTANETSLKAAWTYRF